MYYTTLRGGRSAGSLCWWNHCGEKWSCAHTRNGGRRRMCRRRARIWREECKAQSANNIIVSFWQQGPYYPNPIIQSCCGHLICGQIQFGKDRCSLRYTESSVFYHNDCINKVLLSTWPHFWRLYKPKACHEMVWNVFITSNSVRTHCMNSRSMLMGRTRGIRRRGEARKSWSTGSSAITEKGLGLWNTWWCRWCCQNLKCTLWKTFRRRPNLWLLGTQLSL